MFSQVFKVRNVLQAESDKCLNSQSLFFVWQHNHAKTTCENGVQKNTCHKNVQKTLKPLICFSFFFKFNIQNSKSLARNQSCNIY